MCTKYLRKNTIEILVYGYSTGISMIQEYNLIAALVY